MSRIPGFFALLAFTAAYPPAQAQSAAPQVTVYGTSTRDVVPDEGRWSLHVSHTGADLARIASKHRAAVADLLSHLRQYQIPEEDIQTSRMQFGENWVYRASSEVKEGYIASTSIAFEFSDFRRFTELWIELASFDGVSVSGIQYDHSERIRLRNETRLEALAAAREKAASMAAALGSAIGAPLLIEEQQDSFSSRISNVNTISRASAGAASGEGLAPGTIPVTVSVKVSFQLLQD